MEIKRLEQKWHNFIERLRMSEDDYLTMKRQSENYEKMLSTINVEVKCDSEDITDIAGNVIRKGNVNKNVAINVDTKEMLNKIGITFYENAVLNVK